MEVIKFYKALCFLILLIGCSPEKRQEEDLRIMGNLMQGEHTVGYQTLFVYDKTRPGVPFSDWDGRLNRNHDKKKGRQFQINLWFPAATGTGRPMSFSSYIHLNGQHTSFEVSEAQQRFGEELYISNTNDLAGNELFTRNELEKLMQLKVVSRLNAKPQNGSFPIVLIPGGTPAANHSILAEYLAGRGYVVAGFSPKGRYSSGLEISTIGLETGADDLEFVLGQLSQLPFVDLNQIAIVANAISSSVGALAVCKNVGIKALVSLEGGLPSAFEQRLLSKSVFYAPENFRTPTLFIYAPHPAIDPKYTFHLKYSERYYAHFPNMSEFAMLNYGMFDSIVPGIIGEHEGGTQKGFETAVRLVHRFLNKTLKGENEALFSDDFMNAADGIIDTTFIHKALPPPPNMADLKGIFVEKGFAAIDSIYRELVQSGNPTPFSQPFFTDFRDWLSWKKDPEYVNRKKLYEIGLECYPESATTNFYAGYYGEKTNDMELMKKGYTKAIALIENNADQSLSDSERQAILKNAESALAGI
ncbi:MAG: hypothetical protein RIM99_14115 [Cyclobacteriaceae bacterium]